MTPEEALRDNKRYAGRLGGAPGAARPRRALRRDGQPDRAEQRKPRPPRSTSSASAGDRDRRRPTQRRSSPSPSTTSTTGATRSTPRSSTRSATRRYWEDWAKDVADIATPQTTRINACSTTRAPTSRKEFDAFLAGLRGNLNDGISRDRRDRHARPAPHHPAGLRRALRGLRLRRRTTRSPRRWSGCSPPSTSTTSTTRTRTLEKFYASVRMRVEGIDNAEGRQRIIIELYDNFFATAFKKTVDKLGIVYTPVEIVDFILQLRRRRAAPGVRPGPHRRGRPHPRPLHRHRHLHGPAAPVGPDRAARPRPQVRQRAARQRDPAARLLHRRGQHRDHLLRRDAAVADRRRQARSRPATRRRSPASSSPTPSSPGRTTTADDLDVFPENNERLDALSERCRSRSSSATRRTPSGRTRANDDNANEKYPSLDAAIRDDLRRALDRDATRTRSTTPTSAPSSGPSLRIEDRGVVAFVTNGGWLDSNTADGMR